MKRLGCTLTGASRGFTILTHPFLAMEKPNLTNQIKPTISPMKLIRTQLHFLALASAITATLLTAMDAREDPISAANRADKKAGVAAPGIAETKAIAEEGFIYGLPIVMNYGVMYEYAVDKNSSQFKAPFNQLNSMHRVATPEDTAIVTPNSDTPYSLGFMDLRAEPIVISVPAIEKSRYYSVQLCDGNTFN
jgi:hypothetical protein